jgi:hypothetical protein
MDQLKDMTSGAPISAVAAVAPRRKNARRSIDPAIAFLRGTPWTMWQGW